MSKSIIDEAKASVKANNKKVYTRTEIAWATARVILLVALGILIGVYGTNLVNSTIDKQVVSRVEVLSKAQD